jgi:hypothetical protein
MALSREAQAPFDAALLVVVEPHLDVHHRFGAVRSSAMLRQLELFASDRPAFDASFATLRRIDLDHEAWIDLAIGWLTDHAALFDELERGLPWRREHRRMYDHMVRRAAAARQGAAPRAGPATDRVDAPGPVGALRRGARTHDRCAVSRRQR